MNKYRLDELFDLQMGKTPSRDNQNYWNSKDNKWISIADLTKSDKYITETKEYLSDLAVKESKINIIPVNTVVMSFKLSIGKTAITSEPMYSNEAIMSFRDKHLIELIPDYIYYLFSAKNWETDANKAVKGKTLNKASLSNVIIKVHNKAQQQKIVSILDQVNYLISLRTQQLEQLDLLIKSRFIEMFGNIYKEEYKYPTEKLGKIANVGSSHRVFTTEFVKNGIPFYRGTEIGLLANGEEIKETYYISEEHYQRITSDDSKPQIGDLLLPSICDKGQVWMVNSEKPFYYKDGRVLSIRPNIEIIVPKFLEQYMKIKTIIEYPKLGSGSTFAEFKIFLLKDIDIVVPPLALQTQFATFVEEVEKEKATVKQSLEWLNTLKAKLMQDYFG